MVSHIQEQESLPYNSIFDALYCEEERLDEDSSIGFGFKDPEVEDFREICEKTPIFLFEHDLFWEDDEVLSLLSKEKTQDRLSFEEINVDECLKIVRHDAIVWILKVISHYGFNALTAALAVNYYDRFATSPCFQKDKPWMCQLVAVACVSLAAKVEETQVPLLIDFQVEDSKYLFEAKTIQRMELLVLSKLQWKMNPVTPIPYFDHFMRRLGSLLNPHWEFLGRCESLILSIITDFSLLRYLPSVVAAATMMYVIRDIGPCKETELHHHFVSVLKTSKEKVDECHKLIMEIMDDHGIKLRSKRKNESIPSSPSGVVDAYFSSDSSNDSWAFSSSVSSSPEPSLKRRRAQDQHMKLAPHGLHSGFLLI
ncbi:cyclin-D3-3-like [Primulina eburnea]|uniref:cyclin-D3-3-like n=1 Tax=Primulina eburnea TaxID=1245227 RepID=UPI003C6C148C